MNVVLLTLASLSAGLAMACDDSQAVHAPDFSLARMQEQPRVEPYRGMRVPPANVVPFAPAAEGDLPATADAPPPRTRELVTLGEARYGTFCAPCHGMAGDGVSVVADKMLLRKPPSFAEERLRALDDEQLNAVVTAGYGLMAGYAHELGPRERWAVVAYVRALQIHASVSVDRLTPAMRAELATVAP